MTCFFFGHRRVPEDISLGLMMAVENCYAAGVRDFIVGGYGEFDSAAGSAVLTAKKHHPDICLRRLLPYHPAVRPVKTPAGYDGTFYPDGMENVSPRFAIVRANQFMVKKADWLICYVHHFGNSRELLSLAQKREAQESVHICNLCR